MSVISHIRKVTHGFSQLGRVFQRFVYRFVIGTAFFSSVAALLLVLVHYVSLNQFQTVGFVALTPLAILIGLSGLMYNRTRSIEGRLQRFRSLYIAERLMLSCFYYLFALVLGFLITVILQLFSAASFPAHDLLLVLYAPSMLFCGLAFGELLFGAFAVLHRTLPRHFLRTVRQTKRLL
jgi:hypothetical protein